MPGHIITEPLQTALDGWTTGLARAARAAAAHEPIARTAAAAGQSATAPAPGSPTKPEAT